MDEILKSHNHILRQVKACPVFADHDPTRVPADVVETCDVSSFLVRPLDDIIIPHQINEASVVSMIKVAPGGFPSSRKRVNTLVALHKFPWNELPKVLQNLSLQTQRDTVISTQVS